jgi:thiamine biosynthesis lipoprotein
VTSDATADLPGLRRVEEVMGMAIIADVRDEAVDEALLDRVFDWFRFVDDTFSTYKPESEISRLNRDELHLRECHPDVRFVIARCRELRDETGGYFDAEAVVPGAIDPSGLVKGWSVDRAATILDEAGLRNYTLNAGGDIRLLGDALPERGWRVGIQHPEIRDKIVAVVESDDLAVATSGAYARGEHVVDPHTGKAPVGVRSVTVVGADLATADAYATAAFAMGEQGPEWTRTLQPYEAMTVMAEDRMLSTAGFPFRR